MTDIDISPEKVAKHAAIIRHSPYCSDPISADMLEALAARVRELEGERADEWRKAREARGDRDVSNAVAESARTDVATLLRERDEALGRVAGLERERDKAWKAEDQLRELYPPIVKDLRNYIAVLTTLLDRADKLAAEYEAWEADLIMSGDWSREGVAMDQRQHDAMVELQTKRNALRAAIKAAKATT